MNLIIILYLILTFSSLSAKVGPEKKCSIHTYDKIYYSNDSYNLSNTIIKKSDCPKQIQSTFAKTLLKFKGALRSTYLNIAFKKDFYPYQVTTIPNEIEIQSIASQVQNKIDLPPKWKLTNIKLLSNKRVITLNKNQSINFTCGQCNSTGEKNIKFEISSYDKNIPQHEWMTAILKIKTKVLIAEKNIIANGRSLKAQDFSFNSIDTTSPSSYFTDVSQLKFFKVNRSINPGTPLKTRQLTPINLVKAGVPTQIMFFGDSLKLYGKAMPLRAGKLGEIIRLRNSKSGHNITGKVIDFNKVKVEL